MKITRNMNTYKIKGKVWRWPGEAGWHFLSLDKKLSAEIKSVAKPFIYGSGFVRIKATVGETSWNTALFPYTKEGIYMISINKSVRKKEDILEGGNITVSFSFLKVHNFD